MVELAKKLHIEFWYMPPYCPELNSIEPLWSVIKRDFRARCALKKFETITQKEFSKLLKESCDAITEDVQRKAAFHNNRNFLHHPE